MAHTGKIWRHHDGRLPNTLAFAYVFLAHGLGAMLMAAGSPLAWSAGVLLMAHGLVVAGYLIHDLAHFTVFRTRRLNLGAGEVFSWLCGSAYAPMARIQRMHMRHHGDIADVALFDPRRFLESSPPWFQRLIAALEWCYVPAVELLMHAHVMIRPFVDERYRHERRRVILVGLSRLGFFALLFALSPWALLGYAIAYLLFLTALFLGDAYAHTYEYYEIASVDQAVPRDGRDGEYDRHHTFSNLVSERWPWLNLLNLNFGYHSVHHQHPYIPWHRLPALHRKNLAPGAPQILPYRELWRSFRINRVKRIAATDAGQIGTGAGRADDFLGVHGVSFLSIV